MEQKALQLGEQSVSVEAVLASLQKLRIRPGQLEYSIQDAIAGQFDVDGISYSKEHVLGPRNRIDFLVPGGIGVEVKKGDPTSTQVIGQVERYAGFPAVAILILVVERHIYQHNRAANGKPVYYISLAKQWGIAL